MSNEFTILEKYEQALEAAEQALSLINSVLKRDNQTANYQQQAIYIYGTTASALDNLKKYSESDRLYNETFALLDKALLREPRRIDYQSIKATDHYNLAVSYRRRGQIADALQHYGIAELIAQSVLNTFPQNGFWKEKRDHYHARVADVQREINSRR